MGSADHHSVLVPDGEDEWSDDGIVEGSFDKDGSLVIDGSLEIEGFDDGSLEIEGSDDGVDDHDRLLEEALLIRADIPFCVFEIFCFGRVSIDEVTVEHPMTVKSKIAMANTFFIFP